jgi:prepilin-type N-terminal cleavage/methylation domain-containing protein
MKIISPYISKKQGFTLVELIVGMTIFVVGMTGILSLLNAAISSSQRAKNEIIAANVLREQVEILKNMRNTNVQSFSSWSTGITPNIYTIENDYTSATIVYTNGSITSSPVKLTLSTVLPTDTIEQKFTKSQLYYDAKGRYTHTVTGKSTNIASYLIISPLAFTRPHPNPALRNVEPKDSDGANQGYILDARVIVRSNGYREYDLKTVITDWQK